MPGLKELFYLIFFQKIQFQLSSLIIQQNIHYNQFVNFASIDNFRNYQNNISIATQNKLTIYREIVFKLQNNEKINTNSMEWYIFATQRINSLLEVVNGTMHDILIKGSVIKKDANSSLFASSVFLLFSILSLVSLSLILRKLIQHEEKNIIDLTQQKKYYLALSNMSENIVYLSTKDALYTNLCRIIVQYAGFRATWIGIVDNDKQCITPHIANNISLDKLSRIDFTIKPNQENALKAPEKAYIEKSNVILNKDELELCMDCVKIVQNDIQSIASFPIYQGDDIIAIFTIFSEDKKHFTIELITLIEKMLHGLSFAIGKIEEQEIQLITKENLRIASYAFDSQEAMTITDTNANIIKVNQAFTDITGYSAEEVLGKNPRVLQSSQHDKDFYQTMWEDLKNNGRWKGEIYNQRKNGEIYPEILSITAIKDENNIVTHYIAQFLDISSIKNAQNEAEYKAQHDVLTGIANRAKLLKDTEIAFSRGRRLGMQHAFVFFDIDKFKQVNDSYGHKVGDALLIEIAKRLSNSLRDGDIVARLGGDEFAIVALDISSSEQIAVRNITLLVEKIQKIMSKPIIIDNLTFDITFSMGIKLFPNHEKNAQDVVSHADIAMYKAKKLGRNQFVFFDDELDMESKKFLIIEKDLKLACKGNQFELHYQPKVNTVTNKIVGVEALIRWNHPTKGMIYPDAFLDIANDTRLINEIDDFVINEALKQLSFWQSELKIKNYSISINVGIHQFQKATFVDSLKTNILKYNVDASFLELELLEDVFMTDIDGTIEKIKIIKDLGVKFAIDDFGTGYSSMTYLQKLPVDNIKIDKSFILDINSKSNQEIIKMIINFAKMFDLKVIAEGVENEYSLKFLQDNGCDIYQGYYFSKPIKASEMTALLKL